MDVVGTMARGCEEWADEIDRRVQGCTHCDFMSACSYILEDREVSLVLIEYVNRLDGAAHGSMNMQICKSVKGRGWLGVSIYSGQGSC